MTTPKGSKPLPPGNRPPSRKAKIFVIEDHPLVRRSMQLLISLENDLSTCGEADNGPAALEGIRTQKPDAAIVDLRLKSGGGLDLIKQLRPLRPEMKILVFSMSDEKFYVQQVLQAGANGYMTKDEPTERIIDAIRALLRGECYLSQTVADESLLGIISGKALKAHSQNMRLTERESEILRLIGSGFGTTEIAQKLNLSIKTVASHREHIKGKLNLRDAAELVNYAHTMVNADRQTGSEPPGK